MGIPDYYNKAIGYMDFYDDPECVKNKALCYYHLGRVSHQSLEALSYFIKAINLDRKLAVAYEKIGELYLKVNDYIGALKYFKVVNNSIKILDCYNKLIELYPNDENLRIQKGDYCLTINLSQKAIKYYREAFSLSHDPKFKKQTLQKVGEALKSQEGKINEIMEKVENMDFYNFDEISQEGLEESVHNLMDRLNTVQNQVTTLSTITPIHDNNNQNSMGYITMGNVLSEDN